MSVPEVMHAAADAIEAREPWCRDRDYRHGGGGQVFADLCNAAVRRYGQPAIEHLERILRADLPHGQLQFWRETDPAVVVKVLRDAAGIPVPPDAETAVLRRTLDDLAARLDAVTPGYPSHDPEQLVEGVVVRITTLEAEVSELRARLGDEG